MKNEKGFSLPELMIVVAIIGILASVAVPNYQMMSDRSKYTQVRAFFGTVMAGAALIHSNGQTVIQATGSPCTANDQGYNGNNPLASSNIPAGDAAWKILGQPNGSPYDPWGEPYLLDQNEGEGAGINAERFDVVYSTGADKQWNGGGPVNEDVFGDDLILRIPTLNVYSTPWTLCSPDCTVGL